MKHYIDKDALAAEIERLISNGEVKLHESLESNDDESYVAWAEHIATCIKVLSLLDTLEVKEVDLEKEIDKWWCSLFTDYSMMRVPNHKFVPEPAYIDSNFKQSEIGKTKIAFELWTDWKVDSNDIEWDSDTVRNFAKHFFELGLSVRKGE